MPTLFLASYSYPSFRPSSRKTINFSDGAPADARGLAPPHAGPLGRHTLILTTPSSLQHPDYSRCLAAPPRERVNPGGLSCQLPAQCAAAACCSVPASLHTATA
eukprot:scaffold11371_cov112-Isochrysis_galbana.AAC.5